MDEKTLWARPARYAILKVSYYRSWPFPEAPRVIAFTIQHGGGLSWLSVHPFFTAARTGALDDQFKWLEPLGESKSCLHGINLQPASTSRVAAFDLDGTIIKSRAGNAEWEFWRSIVPAKLKEAHEAGFAIVIISNQAIGDLALRKWKQKISSIAARLGETPFRLLAAIAKDRYRKPMPGMWYELERIFREDDVNIDRATSFFVGDAAGRQFSRNKTDFASTDRKWAVNVGIEFHTPEEYFLRLPPHQNIILPGFHVSSLPDLPLFVPSSKPLLPSTPEKEVVLFVGYPCLGKTTFFRKIFQPAGYIHVSQDDLKHRGKCVKAVHENLKNNQSCVVDNTNRDRATRRMYIDVARELNVPIRCFIFTGSIELAWHNNLYRAFNLPPSIAMNEPVRRLLPYSAFTSFLQKYEEPHEGEGYAEIKKINWEFQGTDEERKYWSMWLQIDGK